jgi:hypothetical protein
MGSAGFTLAEVLIAALISAFVVTAGFQLLINQSKSHLVQAGITDMQQNGRAAIDELSGKIRQAGYLLPLSVAALKSWDTNPDTIAVAFLAEPVCTASLSIAMTNTGSELRCEDSDIGGFNPGDWAYIYDPAADSGEYFQISNVDAATKRIYHAASLSRAYPDAAPLYMIDYYKYYVDDADTTHPVFMMKKNGDTPVVYADNIEDLELRYFYPDGSEADTITLDRYVRKVGIQVAIRTDDNKLPADEIRHDTLSTVVEVRNLAL